MQKKKPGRPLNKERVNRHRRLRESGLKYREIQKVTGHHLYQILRDVKLSPDKDS